MNQVHEQYKRAEESYGSELLDLVVAKGYLKKVLEKDAFRAYVGRNAPEILQQFELVLTTVRIEEAVEHAERIDGPSCAPDADHGVDPQVGGEGNHRNSFRGTRAIATTGLRDASELASEKLAAATATDVSA